MKSATHIKFNFPFEYWFINVSKDPLGNTVTNYAKERDDVGFLVSAGRDAALLTVKPLDVGMIVRNLRDREGNLIFFVDDESYDMYVTSAEPQFDTFSRIIGWRHRLSRDAPIDQTSVFADIGAALIQGA